MGVINVGIQVGSRTYPLVMDLDYEVPTEKLIRDYLARGMLYEPETSATITRLLAPGDIVLDVGAHVGFFSILMSLLVGPTGRVIAFEPGSNNLPRLKNNVALSKLDNITIIEKAASDTAADVKFYLNQDCGGGNAMWDVGEWPTNLKSRTNPTIETIPGTTLDDEIARLGLPVPKLIKMDVEGAEPRVLEGARRLLTGRKVPFVIAEVHNFALAHMNSSPMHLRQVMEDLGYYTFAMYFNGCLPKLIPPGTEIRSAAIVNVLFSTPEYLARVWASDWVEPSVFPQPKF